jgi:dTDP-4-amino-4,6-dideoxygalactose transaminase
MVVHLHGLPADMQSISELAAERGISLIEDFSQAVGASYRGKLVGSIGTVGAASLMAGKNLPSAGEAGILVTNDREIRNKAATLKCFGEAIESDGSYRPLHQTFGYNYRANIISLVFASIQLFRIEEFNELRRSCAAQLNEILETIPGFSPPLEIPGARHIYHMYRFRFDPEEAGLSISADQAREALKEIFLSEGLPLVEFQNHPLSGHALLQQKIAYGRGCPWSCQNAENFQYRNEDFPGALDAIRHSLVIGYPAKAPLTNPEVIAHYIECFKKVQHNMRSFERIGAQLHSKAPWEQEARLF